jgi:hypothetical protein
MKTISLLLALASLILSGCAGGFKNFKRQDALKTAENIAANNTLNVVKQAVETPAITVSGVEKGATVTVNAVPNTNSVTVTAQAAQQAGQTEDLKESKSSKLSLSLAILFGSIALLLLIVAVWLILRSSASARAVYGAADTGIANAITLVSSHAKASSDPAHTSVLNSIQAELEKARGKVSAI